MLPYIITHITIGKFNWYLYRRVPTNDATNESINEKLVITQWLNDMIFIRISDLAIFSDVYQISKICESRFL